MTLFAFSLVVLPVWSALFALYFVLCGHRLQRESLMAKCAASFLSVTSVTVAWLSRADLHPGGWRSLLGSPFLWFFVLCTVGDAVLELSFLPGMICFASGHLCLVVSMFSAANWIWIWYAAVWVLGMAAAMFLFRRELPKMGAMAVAGCAYVGILSATLAVNLPLPFLQRNSGGLYRGRYVCLAVGALLFFVSDLMVAKQQFGAQGKKWQKPIMVTYWLALYLISASAWL